MPGWWRPFIFKLILTNVTVNMVFITPPPAHAHYYLLALLLASS
jgi:hypothetical protein